MIPPLLVGALLGAGVLLIWWSLMAAPAEASAVVGTARIGPRQRLADRLAQAGFDSVTPGNVVTASVILGVLVLLIAGAVSGVLVIGVLAGGLAAYAPIAFIAARARSRRAQLREQWPDAVDNISSAVRAGMSLPEALSQLGTRGPDDLRPAFAAFAEDYRVTGRFNESLDRLKTRLADPVGDRLVESLRLAREVGGSDLGRLLRTLSAFLRDDARTRAELETRQGWTVNAARLAAGAPIAVLVFLSFQREALHAFASPAGALVLLIGAAVTILAYRLMVRIGRLPEDERVLR